MWTGLRYNTCFVRLFSTRSYKQPTKDIIHPYVNEPECLSLVPQYTTAVVNGKQIYVPKNYYKDLAIESTRSGEHLGEESPYNFLRKEKIWRTRKYNVLVNPIPNCVSRVKCVNYYSRLNVWSTHWFENGIHRSRWFKCAYGFLRAKNSAEQFRKDIISFGRVDHLKTKEQKRLDLEKLRSRRSLKIKTNVPNQNMSKA
ncbi:AP2 [Babesia gibsoni]|uniref:AP2 n=1 Tax=Babesia gibsoni TaxID=33632 RepID=A0AAD8UVH3_BABGI|nr:AP2 [Babesia gibsoni]